MTILHGCPLYITGKKLSKAWSESEVAIVADIECSSEGGKELCDLNDIQGFPTLKFGDPYDLKDYLGDIALEDLIMFADENLVPLCSRERMELCNEDQISTIANFTLMSQENLELLEKTEETRLQEAEDKFVEEMKTLQEHYQEKYEEIKDEKMEVIESVKAGGYSLLKSVIAYNKKKDGEEPASNEL